MTSICCDRCHSVHSVHYLLFRQMPLPVQIEPNRRLIEFFGSILFSFQCSLGWVTFKKYSTIKIVGFPNVISQKLLVVIHRHPVGNPECLVSPSPTAQKQKKRVNEPSNHKLSRYSFERPLRFESNNTFSQQRCNSAYCIDAAANTLTLNKLSIINSVFLLLLWLIRNIICVMLLSHLCNNAGSESAARTEDGC